jgi:hypothetical protein
LSGEHPDREPLPLLGIEEEAIDIPGRVEGSVDDRRLADDHRLVFGSIGVRTGHHRERIDEKTPGR